MVYTPTTTPFVGPGYGFDIDTNFAEDPTHNYTLDIQVRDSVTGITACHIQHDHYHSGMSWVGQFGVAVPPNVIVSQGAAGGAYGNDAVVEYQLFDLTTSTAVGPATTVQGFFHDPVGNLSMVIEAYASSAAGGFNAQDRTLLSDIHRVTYIPGYSVVTTHVGLTDNGSLNTLPGTRALRVTVTAFPPTSFVSHGTPEYFFGIGFFTLNVQQGWVRSQRLVFEFQLYEAPLPLDSFGWTLNPGGTINVEELQPLQ
jgi:hypothetical protein